MTKSLWILVALFFVSKTIAAQDNDIPKKIDSLRYLRMQPFACNSVYWRVIAIGKDAIPFLIERLDDTGRTQISLTCKISNVRFGDICFEVLTQIISIPIFYVTKHQFDVIDQYGCQSGLSEYIDTNRQLFRSQVAVYYNTYKEQLKFVRYNKDYKNDCKKINKIYGYYNVDAKFLQRE